MNKTVHLVLKCSDVMQWKRWLCVYQAWAIAAYSSFVCGEGLFRIDSVKAGWSESCWEEHDIGRLA